MPSSLLADDLIERYLRALEVTRREPSAEALAELVAAHVMRVPFENISKLHRKKRLGLTGLPSIALFLEGIEQYHFGGTCYSNNFHFCTLLASLGYRVRLCGADMSSPDVHMVIMVEVDGREYLVDGGYAAPFLSPLPRDLTEDYVITLGRDRYVLKPQDGAGCSRLEMYRDGVVKHGYLAKPVAKKIEDFGGVIADSFRASATFLNALLLARFYRDRSVVIHNLTVIESQGPNTTIRPLGSREELVAEVERQFGIPRAVVGEAVSELHELVDAWA
jgi:N-hydroxyarylamine O-acetyltransferase